MSIKKKRIPSWFNIKNYADNTPTDNITWVSLLRQRSLLLFYLNEDNESSCQQQLELIASAPMATRNMAYTGIYDTVEPYQVFQLKLDYEQLKRDKKLTNTNDFTEDMPIVSDHVKSVDRDCLPFILSLNLLKPDRVLLDEVKAYITWQRKKIGVPSPKRPTKQTRDQQISNRWLPLLDLYFHKKIIDNKLLLDDIYLTVFHDFDELSAYRKGKEQLKKAKSFIGNLSLVDTLEWTE